MKGYFSLTKPYFTIRSEQDSRQCASQNQTLLAIRSFCIGAATAAANGGLEDSTIVHWEDGAAQPSLHTYIRTPREQLAKLSKALSVSLSQQHT